MKIGLIGRADDRGIGIQTWEFHRHMPVHSTLVVLTNDRAFPEDPARFGSDVVHVDSNLSTKRDQRGLDERKVRRWLQPLDVVFAVETVYDWRLIDWAHDAGVKVVIQGNPEFYCHHQYGFPQPDRWVWPTGWMLDELGEHLPPEQLDVLPVPTVDRPSTAADPEDDALRVLHVVGRPAAGDRQGTLEFVDALASIRGRVHVTLTSQEGGLPSTQRLGRDVTCDVISTSQADRWELYRNQHILVSPRKYGGLHLPGLEAMASGLALVMPDCSPNGMWPGRRMKTRKGQRVRTPFGGIQMAAVHPFDIARQIDIYARDRAALSADMAEAKRWADFNTWEAHAEYSYMPLFEEVLS